jgi:hypothetical protein
MKNYIEGIVDLTGDTYLNPSWPGHGRDEGIIKTIAVHHDATPRPHDYDSIARYRNEAAEHYARLGPGLQYHYKIDNTGVIFKIRPHNLFLWHAGDDFGNVNGIAICLDGYFHPNVNQVPTREQYEALQQLLDWLCTQNPQFPAVQGDVYPHRHFSSTACCGDNLVPFVDSYRTNGGTVAIPDVPYDWPEFQPQINPTPTPPPAPIGEIHDDLYRVFLEGKQIGAYRNLTGAQIKVRDNPGSTIKFHGSDFEYTPAVDQPIIPLQPGDPVIVGKDPETEKPVQVPPKQPVAEGTKETVRTAIIAGASYLLSIGLNYLTGLPQTEVTVILTLVLKGIDKYIHENPNINLKGLSPL